MPRGRRKLSLDEKIQETKQSIEELEDRVQELYARLEELEERKRLEKLEALSEALSEAGVSVEDVLARMQADAGEDVTRIA